MRRWSAADDEELRPPSQRVHEAPGEPDLFSPNPVAHTRPSHPVTSHEAAERVTDLSTRKRDVLAALRELGAATNDELTAHYQRHWRARGWIAQTDSGIRSRRSELGDDRLVVLDALIEIPGKRGRVTKWRAVEK